MHTHLDVYKLRWSPEIEAVFPINVSTKKLKEKFKKFLHTWTVTDDYSLVVYQKGEEVESGLEFKPKSNHILRYNKDTFEEIDDVVTLIKKHKGFINSSCGGHIHIDATPFKPEQILRIVKYFIKKQLYIIKEFKVYPSRLESQCQLIPQEVLNIIKKKHIIQLMKGELDNPPHYVFEEKHFALNLLNLYELKTLEFRIFNGTLNTKEIKRRVKFLFNLIQEAI